ncbi:MAG: acetyl-CoA carboxylase biotin carboxyl carrier protein [candidate division Zixibacteria bacterium]|jgi:acetyl-CoA carboxylase biotin carboxyl carrier protein|nr:acetyl-CoA carboxylase biotin carboxyl carrier protein [candidate division Zixibacteria bacterium]
MRTSKIRALIRLVEDSGIEELEVTSWGRKVSIRKKAAGSNNNGHNPQVASKMPDKSIETAVIVSSSTPVGQSPEQPAAAPPVNKPAPRKENLQEIKSPMVGTFYRAPAPDARPFVEVGEKVSRGQVVCIIEAMKLMNEIESEFDGRVAEILVQNAQPVQFGQPLILIEPL